MIASSESPIIIFKKEELPPTSKPYADLILKAYNYSNKTIENSVYVFELSTQTGVQFVITP